MRAAEFDNPGIDACRPPAGYLRRNGVGQHHPQAFLDLMQYAADLCAEDEAVASQRCRHQVRRLLRKAGKLLEFPAHLRIGTIAAGGEDDAPACSDRFARTHYDAGHSAVFDRKASDVLIGEHRHAAGTQHLEEMADQAQPLDAHVLPSAITKPATSSGAGRRARRSSRSHYEIRSTSRDCPTAWEPGGLP